MYSSCAEMISLYLIDYSLLQAANNLKVKLPEWTNLAVSPDNLPPQVEALCQVCWLLFTFPFGTIKLNAAFTRIDPAAYICTDSGRR